MPSLVTKSCSKVDLLCVMDFVTTHLIKYSGHTQAILEFSKVVAAQRLWESFKNANAQVRVPCSASTSENHKKESPVDIQ